MYKRQVKELREIGIQADILLCRSEVPLSVELREKIALFCNVPARGVIEAPDVRSIYEVPLVLEETGLTVEVDNDRGGYRLSSRDPIVFARRR